MATQTNPIEGWGMRGAAMKKASPQLWKHVGELASSSAFLLYLSDVGSDRMTLTQAAFFMLAATADASGKPATRTELLEAYKDSLRGSIRNSYRQLLEPSRSFPRGLGWLRTEANPDDDREQFLRLTDKGQSVVLGVLLTLETQLEKKGRVQ
jgi:hypothetical protein